MARRCKRCGDENGLPVGLRADWDRLHERCAHLREHDYLCSSCVHEYLSVDSDNEVNDGFSCGSKQ